MPFVAHTAVRAEFERRWRRVRPLLVAGFLGPPAESAVTAAVGGGRGAVGWVVLAVGCAVPVVTFFVPGLLRRTGWWAAAVVVGAVVQVVGVGLVTSRVVLVLPPLVAAVLGVLAVSRARTVLLDAEDGALAGTSLVMRSRSRAVPGEAGWKPVLAWASADDRSLRWRVGTGEDLHGGEVALRDIGAVWVAHADDPPGGPVVAVQAGGRVRHIVVGDPEGFAWLLDRRVRAFGVAPDPP